MEAIIKNGFHQIIQWLFSYWWNKEYIMSASDENPLPPGNMGLPIVGETIQFLVKGTAYFTEKTKQYGEIFKCHFLGSPTIRISGADNIRSLIDREPKQLTMKWPTAVNILMGPKSLPTVVGTEHTTLKSDLQKAFNPTRLEDYFPCVQQHIHEHIQHWIDEGQQKRQVLSFPACEDLIADIMLELVLGCRKEDDKDGQVRKAFRDVNHNIFSIPIRFPFGGFNKACNARQVILDFVKSRMTEKGSEKDHVSMMDILLSLHCNDKEAMDEEKVKDNVIGLLLAASSSTSGALTCLLLQLGKHAEVLENIREELKAVGLFGKDADAELSYSLLQRLEYVQCVMKESLRCLPPVGGVYRKSVNQMDLNKYKIPSDWTIIYSIRDTHYNTAKLLPDGNVFLPSRWQKQEWEKMDNSSKDAIEKMKDSSLCYNMPFGFGPRICLGRQLAKMILQVFIVKLAMMTDWEVHNSDSPLVHLPVTKPSDDLPVTFHKL